MSDIFFASLLVRRYVICKILCTPEENREEFEKNLLQLTSGCRGNQKSEKKRKSEPVFRRLIAFPYCDNRTISFHPQNSAKNNLLVTNRQNDNNVFFQTYFSLFFFLNENKRKFRFYKTIYSGWLVFKRIHHFFSFAKKCETNMGFIHFFFWIILSI